MKSCTVQWVLFRIYLRWLDTISKGWFHRKTHLQTLWKLAVDEYTHVWQNWAENQLRVACNYGPTSFSARDLELSGIYDHWSSRGECCCKRWGRSSPSYLNILLHHGKIEKNTPQSFLSNFRAQSYNFYDLYTF